MNLLRDLNKIDFFLFFVFSLLTSYLIQNFFIPHEDASILFRYSENFATNGVISYNINGNPTEGATDFLWMILLSLFYFLGFNTFFASILINLLSLYFIAKLLKNYYSLTKFEFYLIIFFHFSLSQMYAALGGFSVIFVELILVLLIINFLRQNVFNTLLFSFIGCLVRPDFFLFILVPNIINLINNFNFKNIKLYLIFILLGLFYFYLRFIYFGYLLPLPFYIKNQWHILNNLEWLKQIIIISPILLIVFFINIKKIFKKSVLSILAIIFIATSYYTNQILYQNIGYRFYFYIPILVIFIIYEFKLHNKKSYKSLSKNFLLLFSIVSIFLNIIEKYDSINFYTKKDDVYIISKELKKINKSEKLYLATTEAGILPYFSEIETIDLFGLNTKKFAKLPADGTALLNNHFDIIVINSSMTGNNCKSLNQIINRAKNLQNKTANRSDNWDNFTFKLLSGINIDVYDAYFYTYPTNIFVNKKSKAYNEITKIIDSKKLEHCKF